MWRNRRLSLFALIAAVMLCLPLSAGAQGELDGELTVGAPSLGAIATPGEVLRFSYTLNAPSRVVLQALGETAAPTVTIQRGDLVVADDANNTNALALSVSALLLSGSYVIEVGAVDGGTGTMILIVQSETAISVTPLALGERASGRLDADTPAALYTFGALSEPAYLTVAAQPADAIPTFRVINTATGGIGAAIFADVSEARLRFEPTGATYQIEIFGGDTASKDYTICLASVSAGTCGESITLPATPAASNACTVTPNGVVTNIRQSASTSTAIVGTLAVGAQAAVIGIAPDGSFFNVLHNNINGWVATSVVTANGNCANVPAVNPPPIPPTPVPPTQPPQPTQPPPPPTASGPCMVTFNSAALVYTQTTAIPDYIFDQVQAGVQVMALGRTGDNSWWKVQTAYADAWMPTSYIGGTVSTSGSCNVLTILSS